MDDGVGPRGIVLRACTSASWLRDEGKTPNQALNPKPQITQHLDTKPKRCGDFRFSASALRIHV